MDQRISLITLGVRDLDCATRFYRDLGWAPVDSPDGVVAFDLIGQTLGLFPLDALAQDIGLPVSDLGTGAATLAHNLRDRAGVDDLMRRAETAGADILKPATESFWGGYHGYFRDLDGHIWEIAHNPFAPLSPDGAFRWNGY
ncbi:VOC family protein [Actibacterium ureilyticum]|uniref:VOC family protein n=1 Tax=Actibacterium ureilyticum TaxID=1590614 RepID=UPI000BAAC11A|nr:VOC family protein [Actibacterium ureilyticum]